MRQFMGKKSVDPVIVNTRRGRAILVLKLIQIKANRFNLIPAFYKISHMEESGRRVRQGVPASCFPA